MNKLAMVEALLFASKRGIDLNQLSQIIESPKAEALSLLEELREKYAQETHGVKLGQVGKLYSFYTKPEYAETVAKLVIRPMEKLTPSQLEVLAVVAKKGPVKKSQIDEIRGKGSDNQVIELLAMGLVRRKRAKGPGRPFAYSVTELFYDLFHLSDEELNRYKPPPEDEETVAGPELAADESENEEEPIDPEPNSVV
ncbi:MAG TPA: SMC-Scp complex subunit ScpB [Thermotogota bacterium]|nr:SMC-Scp complex subunit ScpB [Thermotogota bacterium]HQK82017.1 SMC-Scp complex subunit ScpB [Thermotogota bacterium]